LRIEIKLSDLPPNFEPLDVMPCPVCKKPIIWGNSDQGLNSITDGGKCCYQFVMFCIERLKQVGILADDPTTLDVVNGVEVKD
tara:strand:- start:267 stop:515 length:249 start_codon:yes stop_codon:yes gene_type:complete